jgi:GntR family transcriptional regulator/MocR family aminotransferase
VSSPSSWQLAIALDESARRPLFQQISEGIIDAVVGGRLRAGDRLPSSRALAGDLEVHRNTVLAAYDELIAQGWVETAQGRGTFVSGELPDTRRRPSPPDAAVPEQVGFPLPPAPRSRTTYSYDPGRDIIDMTGGVPDVRLAPAGELARAYGRAMRSRDLRTVLDYRDERGSPRLRAALADMLNALRGLSSTADDLMITRGSQMALYLIAHSALSRGSTVVVESLGYSPAWEAFRSAGAELTAVGVDREGLRVDRLEALLARKQIAAVYLTPHHHYPTMVTLSGPRRLQLLELARKHRFAVIEDDYDNEVHYEGRPVLPMASADRSGVVVYVGTLSKILAPGVRIGYVVAPRPLLARLAMQRVTLDRQGDPAVEAAVAELIEDGVVQRHARRMRRVYRTRRDALVAALGRHLGDAVGFDVPAGGMALWVRARRGIDVDGWAERCAAAGVRFRTARAFAFDRRSRPFVRLAYAPCTEREIRRAVKRMAASLG